MHQPIFDDRAAEWWDEKGAFKPLHMLNPVRMHYILEHVRRHFKEKSMEELSFLDVGCGGGLISEPLARLGAHVTGIDLSENAIDVARTHAKAQGLSIDYQCTAVENLSEHFDVVIASEVIEHVNDQQAFVHALAARLKPGGCFVITTLNRTWKSKVFGIWAAEYVLRWAPIGTHIHDLFVTPSELFNLCEKAELRVSDLKGLSFNPLTGEFSLSNDMDINYFAFGVKV